MLNLILVPLDGSGFGEQAIPTAIRIAERERGALEFVHVVEWLAPYLTQGAPPLDPELDLALREDRASYLRTVAASIRQQTSVPVTATVLDGPDVTTALAEHLETRRADLVVMATHGRGGLSRLWLGSVASDLARRSLAPVLLVKPSERGSRGDPSRPYARVLIPLDGSPTAEEALEHATAIAHDAEYVLLHVIEPILFLAEVATPAPDDEQAELAYLEKIADRIRARGLVAETRLLTHPQPAQAILECAQERRADLIAMETHGRSGVRRLLLGSVADKVMRASPVPVLVHRPHVEADHRQGETSAGRTRSGALRP